MSHYLQADYAQVLLFPPCVDDWVPADHPVRLVRDFVQALSLPTVGIAVPSLGGPGHPAYHPALLLAVWLYGYMRKIRTPRTLELACTQDMGFIWLAGNLRPDHNTLWRFFTANREAFHTVFRMLVKTAKELQLIGLVLHALDGTKLPSACNKEGALHREDLTKVFANLDQHIEALIVAAEAATAAEQDSQTLPMALCDAQARRQAIQEQLAQLDAAEANHVQPREPDARMQKCADGKTRFGYNAQAVRDLTSGLVVAETVVNAPCDTGLLTPMLAEVTATLGETAEVTAADGGYVSGAEVLRAEEAGYEVLLNLTGLMGDPGKGAFHKRCFTYEALTNTYRCPHGERLRFSHLKKKTRTAGDEEYAVAVYQGTRCRTCPVRAACTTSKTGRRVERNLAYDDALDRQFARQASPENQWLLKMRSQIIEPLFAFIKDTGGFRRFTCQGLPGVRAQWTLLCTGHNLRTLVRLWQAGRFTLEAMRLAVGRVLAASPQQSSV